MESELKCFRNIYNNAKQKLIKDCTKKDLQIKSSPRFSLKTRKTNFQKNSWLVFHGHSF